MYPPGRDWSFLGYELEAIHTWSAERKIRSSLPWRVRFGVEWDWKAGSWPRTGTGSRSA